MSARRFFICCPFICLRFRCLAFIFPGFEDRDNNGQDGQYDLHDHDLGPKRMVLSKNGVAKRQNFLGFKNAHVRYRQFIDKKYPQDGLDDKNDPFDSNQPVFYKPPPCEKSIHKTQQDGALSADFYDVVADDDIAFIRGVNIVKVGQVELHRECKRTQNASQEENHEQKVQDFQYPGTSQAYFPHIIFLNYPLKMPTGRQFAAR
jgi:hypothetical protein